MSDAKKNNTTHVIRWALLANQWTPSFDSLALPPVSVSCQTCWDTGICGECLGQYPKSCPGECVNGQCHCTKGEAE